MDEMREYLGLDVGSTTVKGVVIDGGGTILRGHIEPVTGNYQQDIARVRRALDDGGLGEYQAVVATGYGQDLVADTTRTLSEISCHARGLNAMNPEIRRVIDVGGQDLKVISISEVGKPLNFVMNDKCAAGTGRFLDVMARALSVETAELAALSSRAEKGAKISSMCTVFAESEVISLLARETPPAVVARGLMDSIAQRIGAMVTRLGAEGALAMTGGVARNRGVVEAVERAVKAPVLVPGYPQLAGALGAALCARDAVAKAAAAGG